LWQDPVDLETRDLYYGMGGQKGAPDPSSAFIFIQREVGGILEKIQVKDDKKRDWTVKFGEEARSETTATRIVWAAGYHVDQDYFVRRVKIEGRGGIDARDVRFERDDDGFKSVGRWSWDSNPFAGTRELDGLKVLMALLNNFDLKTENNKIVCPKKESQDVLIYYVNDLGATLGSTGYWFTELPLVGELPAGSKGVANHFANSQFIDSVKDGVVVLHNKRRRAQRALEGVKVENARWMGGLLSRLSNKQLTDAFRAGGFDDAETATYVRALQRRIRQLTLLPMIDVE
jgi:hypothetical protein